MISVEIEKEIDQENKIILNLNFRQFICVGLLAAFVIVLVLILKMPSDTLIYPVGIFAIICFFIGWYNPNGIPSEKYALKYIQELIYHSNVRKYKTKNQYVTMVNEEYARRQHIDLGDKQIAKAIKKEQKEQAKKLKKAAKNSVCKPVA